MFRLRCLALGFGMISVAMTSSPASAVVIAGLDPTNATIIAPEDDPGWANVGKMDSSNGSHLNGSCVYLGNGWVLTAYHISQPGGVGNPLFGDTRCHWDGNTENTHRLQNADGTYADLFMFHLSDAPSALRSVAIRSDTLSSTSQATAIGFGCSRGDHTWWDSSWQEVTDPSKYEGYKLGGWGQKRWGTSGVSAVPGYYLDDGYGYTSYLQSDGFSLGDGDTDLQGSAGDSGGGLFYKNGSQWELAGITLAIDWSTDKPQSLWFTTAVYGDWTDFADLSHYQPQIATYMATPEPSSIALLTIVAIGAIAFARRRAAV
jgi:hypothetical protein